jgi:hypothetical protein
MTLVSGSVFFRFVEVRAGWEIGKIAKAIRGERLGDDVFAVQPFAEIDQLAAFRAEGGKGAVQPEAGLATSGAFCCAR